MRSSDALQEIVCTEGLVSRRRHPELACSIDWWVRRGLLTPVLPGVYAPAESASDALVRIHAVAHWDPAAILTGAAAARLTYWPEAPLSAVEVAVAHRRSAQPGYVFRRRRIAPHLIWHRGEQAVTAPALTAMDLATMEDARAIDIALRKRVVTLAQLHAAFDAHRGRPGNPDRQALLLDSRAEPWSQAERLGHRLLRGADLTGWRANFPVVGRGGQTYYLDIAFRKQRLAIEIDGQVHMTDRSVFESDRWRQNDLVCQGWRVLRFTWIMLADHPAEVIDTVRSALRQHIT